MCMEMANRCEMKRYLKEKLLLNIQLRGAPLAVN